jgi:ribosomal protein S27AE
VKQDFDTRWNAAMTELMSGLKEWRLAHPRARLIEIEQEAARRMAKLTALIVEDMALASDTADVPAAQARGEAEPTCPRCGGRVRSRGKHARRLIGAYDHPVELERSYVDCPACGTGFFPPG